MSLLPPHKTFECRKCETIWDDSEPNWVHENQLQSCCPTCGLLCIKLRVCGLCRNPIGKTSKGKRCGFCYAVFTDRITEQSRSNQDG